MSSADQTSPGGGAKQGRPLLVSKVRSTTFSQHALAQSSTGRCVCSHMQDRQMLEFSGRHVLGINYTGN